MNPITAGWIATAGHVLCGLALVGLVLFLVSESEERRR